MTVIFRSVPVDVPFTFESVGTEWEQPHVVRPEGYPYYHYLQTEKGSGRIDREQGWKIAEMIGECAELCAASPYKKELLSVSCYRMLLAATGCSWNSPAAPMPTARQTTRSIRTTWLP